MAKIIRLLTPPRPKRDWDQLAHDIHVAAAMLGGSAGVAAISASAAQATAAAIEAVAAYDALAPLIVELRRRLDQANPLSEDA